MAEIIKMPRMSDTMEEGVIVAWHKKVGDTVQAGDLLAEIETDKATMEFESYQEGVLLHIGVEEGAVVPVEGILAVLGEKGEKFESLLKEAEEASSNITAQPVEETAKPEPVASAPAPVAPVSQPASSNVAATSANNGRIKASPLARKVAEDNGIELSRLQGSGPDGRIIKRDIQQAIEHGVSKPQASVSLPSVMGVESYEDVRLSQMRKIIAKRLAESKFQAPHFYLKMEINMDNVVAARKGMNELSPVKISFNDIIVKACALALRNHPGINASWTGEAIRYNKHIHIGVAVAVEEGLVVPVLQFADHKTLSHLAAEVRELAGKAKDKKLTPEEMQGSTFSISNLGMFGIDDFTAIINPPNSCILAIGAIRKEPRVLNGEIAVANVMKVTLSCDHRVVDGAKGAQYLQTVKAYLENPLSMMI